MQDEDFSDDNAGDEDQHVVLIENKAFTGMAIEAESRNLSLTIWREVFFYFG